MKPSADLPSLVFGLVLVGTVVAMVVSGVSYERRYWERTPAVQPTIPAVAAIHSAIARQTTALTNLGRRVAGLVSDLDAHHPVQRFIADDELPHLAAIQEKVSGVGETDDAIAGAVKDIQKGLGTLEAVRERPGEIKDTARIPTPAELAGLQAALASLQASYAQEGVRVRAAFQRAIAVVDEGRRRANVAGVHDVENRRNFLKVSRVRSAIDEELANVSTRHSRIFNEDRVNILVYLLVVSGLVLYFIWRGRRGDALSIRRISGLGALDEAVGRATEMGKPVLYVTGTQDIDDIQTLAGLNVLAHVAKKTAEYEADLNVPNRWPMTLSAGQEIVREAYMRAGKPDDYQPEKIYFMTNDQFAFAAGVSGVVQRDRPAAVFYMGSFYAESLLMAEVGNVIGAIQISGTAQPTQLPFFVATCDYTLIGEELFAASAYLSGEPVLLGSLKGQDMAKFLLLAAIVMGIGIELCICFDLVPYHWNLVHFFGTR
jgi:hypothetical protein